MKEELHPARHHNPITERRPKAPVAGCLDGGAIEGRCHTTHEPHPRDVPLRVDIDLYRDIAARAAGRGFLRVGSLLLLQHLRRLDRRCRCVLCVRAGQGRNQGAEAQHKTRPATEAP